MAADPRVNLSRFADGITRWGLYEVFFQSLVERETGKAARRPISEAARLEFLREVAFWLWTERGGATAFAAADLPDRLVESLSHGDAADIDALKREYLTGSFLEKKSGDIYYFGHRSFAEYLVAERMLAKTPSPSDQSTYSALVRDGVLTFLKETPDRERFRAWLDTISSPQGDINVEYFVFLGYMLGGRDALADALVDTSIWHPILGVFEPDMTLNGHAPLLARSRSTSGRSITGKKRTGAKIRVPTAEEFRVLDEAQTATSPPWRNAGRDWRCPCCERNKFEILRLSNKRAWRAAIMLLNDYSRETDPESLRRRDRGQNLPITLSKHRQIGVCHDCRQIVTDAMSARPGTDQDSLRIADLATLVGESQPHARHSVDKDAIMAAIDANAAWILAVKDFWVHREEAIAIRFEQWRLMRNGGVSPQAARRVLVPGLVAAGTLPSDDPESWFDWMIMEGERLSAGDEQEGI